MRLLWYFAALGGVLLRLGAWAQSAPGLISPSRSGDVLTVQGNHLVLNGQPIVLKGAVFMAFVVPPDHCEAKPNSCIARQHWGPPLLRALKLWGANAIRLNFSQNALDPRGSWHSPAYLDDITQAVRLARSMGFLVIVNVQAEADPNRVGFPTDATERANLTLAKLFGGDEGVLIDVFNEPGFDVHGFGPTPDHWNIWLSGGDAGGVQTIGMQRLVTALRRAGSRNVLLLQGLTKPQTLAGVPFVVDPLKKYGYATHPFFVRGNRNPEDWQQNFGYLADQNRLVVIDAWTYNPAKLSQCAAMPPEEMSRSLLDFVQRKRIGLLGFAFDRPNTMVADFQGTPSRFESVPCAVSGSGPGELLRKWMSSS